MYATEFLMIILNHKKMTQEMCYQKKNSEESIKDVIPVRQVTSPTKSHYFQQHLY